MNGNLAPIDDWLNAPREQLRAEVFAAAQVAAAGIATSGVKADAARDIVIRLRALLEIRSDDISDFQPIIEALTREVGLFPYLDANHSPSADAIAREVFRSPSDPNLIFHIEQLRIFAALAAGRNVVASAPTSFGKSLIIDSLIGQEHIKRAAIIVPTLALLDETRKRLLSKFGGNTTIVFHRSQQPAESGKVIFLGTQERLLDRQDIGFIDLLIVDEFYKADPARSDGRFIALNAAISRLSRLTKQFFLIGPFIDGIDARGWRYAEVDFIKTSYKTVAVDTVNVDAADSEAERLAKYIQDDNNLPALIFVRSPKSAADLAEKLISLGLNQQTDWSGKFSQWLAKTFTPEWTLVKALAQGVGYHHGRLPRAVASSLVRAFNRGDFKVLLCTSTLIEGVNTAAKSVFIWDKQIDGKNLDFFTVANIRGRAGRMGQHYVGKVFHFHAQPAEEENEVQVPGLGGAEIDEILVHYDSDEIPEPAKQRLTNWAGATGLSLDDLKRFGGMGFDRLVRLRERIAELDRTRLRSLSWEGALPSYDELKTLCELIYSAFDLRRSGAKGSSQLTFFTWRLYKSRTLTAFINDFLSGPRPTQPDDLFAFLRTCEFNLPEMMMAAQVSLISNARIYPNYSLFVARLENWFRPEGVKSLEEVGFPIVVYEKLGLRLPEGTAVDDIVRASATASLVSPSISDIEAEMINSARVL